LKNKDYKPLSTVYNKTAKTNGVENAFERMKFTELMQHEQGILNLYQTVQPASNLHKKEGSKLD